MNDSIRKDLQSFQQAVTAFAENSGVREAIEDQRLRCETEAQQFHQMQPRELQ